MICPSKLSYQSNQQARDPHANKSSALRKGYPQGWPQKEERGIQRAVTHFHHGPTASPLQGRPCHTGPLQLHPAQDALFGDETNAHSVAGAEEVPFCRFKK